MTILIVCGTPWCDLSRIQATLKAAGVSPAKPAGSGSVTTPEVWHDRLFAGSGQGKPRRPVQPGKAWELAASEIFLANWDQTIWGWADHRSTWLLDFWRDFDPQTRFVLLHTPAAQVLAKAASQAEETSSFDAQAVLRAWCAYHEQMLHFFHRHRDRCTWVHHDPSRISASDWLASLPEEWGLRRERQDDPSDGALGTAEPNEVDTLLLSLSTQAVLQDEAVSTLQSEIWASLPACPESLEDTTQRHGQLDALQTLRLVQSVALGGRRELQQNLQAAQARQAAEALANSETQARLQTRLAAKELECYNLQEQLNTEAHARADAQMRITTETQARESLQAQLDAQTKACAEASQESELLLTQLHQVQEELESHFLQREQA